MVLMTLYLQLGQTPVWKYPFFWVYPWFLRKIMGRLLDRLWGLPFFFKFFIFFIFLKGCLTFITVWIQYWYYPPIAQPNKEGFICYIVQIHSTTTLRPCSSSLVLQCPVAFARHASTIDDEGSMGEDVMCDLLFFEIWVWGGEKQHLRVGNAATGSCHCLWFEEIKGLGFWLRWIKWRRERERVNTNQKKKLSNLYKLTNSGHICSWCLFLLSLIR